MITLTGADDLYTLARLVAERLCIKKGKVTTCTVPTEPVYTSGLTSVGLFMPPSLFTVVNSPLTANGTISASFKGQPANTVLAGPATGVSGVPTFRALTLADLPPIAGTGTVTDVTVVTANGFAGTVANSTSTPAITLTTTVTGLLKGNGTAISAAVAGTDYLVANQSINFTPAAGDVTGSAVGTTSLTPTLTIGNDVVTYAKMQNVSATSRFLGRITAGAGDPEELTGTQATTLLDVFTTVAKGLVPSPGGVSNTTDFLRRDGTWAAPAGGGGNTIYTANDALTGNRIVDLAGFTLNFEEGGQSLLRLDPANNTFLASYNSTGGGNLSSLNLNSTTVASEFNLQAQFNSGATEASISGYTDGTIITLGYFAGNHNFSNPTGLTSSLENATLFVDGGIGQYIAEFAGSETNYAGFLVRATEATAVPFVQLQNDANSDVWSIVGEIDGSFSIKEGSALGTNRINIAGAGGNLQLVGPVELDGLNNDVTQDQLVGQTFATGVVGFVSIGAGLSLVAGELSATGGGGGSSLFPTTGTGTATGNVIGDLDGNTLEVQQNGVGFLTIDPTAGNEMSRLKSINEVTGNYAQVELLTAEEGVQFTILGDFDGVNNVQIQGTAVSGSETLTYLADTHTFTGGIHLSTGTATAGTAPLYFTAGTELTTPVSGVMNFDGTRFLTTTASGRGYTPTVSFVSITSNNALASVTTAQAVFPAALDTWAIQANTMYEIEGRYHFNMGATNHLTSIGFTLGGGATLTSISYDLLSWNNAPGVGQTAQFTNYADAATAITASLFNSATTITINFKGHIRVNAGGTLQPFVQFSAAPGGTNETVTGSYLKLIPVGSNTTQSIGNVS